MMSHELERRRAGRHLRAGADGGPRPDGGAGPSPPVTHGLGLDASPVSCGRRSTSSKRRSRTGWAATPARPTGHFGAWAISPGWRSGIALPGGISTERVYNLTRRRRAAHGSPAEDLPPDFPSRPACDRAHPLAGGATGVPALRPPGALCAPSRPRDCRSLPELSVDLGIDAWIAPRRRQGQDGRRGAPGPRRRRAADRPCSRRPDVGLAVGAARYRLPRRPLPGRPRPPGRPPAPPGSLLTRP